MNLKLSIEDLIISLELYYPFTIDELERYKGNLKFGLISKNENVQWDYHVLKEFESLWNWNLIGENRGVNSKITLGLLFPERFELMGCDCFRLMDFCECYKQEPRNLKYEHSLKSEFHKLEYRKQFGIEFYIKNYFTSDDLKTVFVENEIPLRYNTSIN